MARHLIHNVSVGTAMFGPDYGPIPDELADRVTNESAWSVDDDAEPPEVVTSPPDGSTADDEAEPTVHAALGALTVPVLTTIADENGIDIPRATRKPDLVALLADAGITPPED